MCQVWSGPGKWQVIAELTADKPISEIFHASCPTGGSRGQLKKVPVGKGKWMEITQIPFHFLSGSLPPSHSCWDGESLQWCIWTDYLVSNAELLSHQSSHVVPSWCRGGIKNVLRELEVGNTPVFVAFGLLLLFFLAGKNQSPTANFKAEKHLTGRSHPNASAQFCRVTKTHAHSPQTARSVWTLW